MKGRAAIGWVLPALSIVAAVCSTAWIGSQVIDPDYWFVDWQTYANAAERALMAAPIYAQKQLVGPYLLAQSGVIGYSYPPASALMVALFIAKPVGLWLWLVVNIGLLVSGLAAIVKREMRRLDPPWLALCVFGLAVHAHLVTASRPATRMSALRGCSNGHGSLRTAGSLGYWPALAESQRSSRLALVGLARSVQRKEAVAAASITILAISILVLPWAGPGTWVDYSRALSNSQRECFLPSIACVLGPLVGVAAAKLTGIIVAVVLVELSWFSRSRLVAYALTALAWLAPVSDIHAHYLLVLYVFSVAAVAHIVARPRRTQAQGAVLRHSTTSDR